MNEPRRHHYIPQFYLRQWCGGDGRVVCYKRVPSGLVHQPVRPKSTAYETDLYALAHLPDDLRQWMETAVTADVDSRAATALRKMVDTQRTDTLTDADRLGWAQFVVSLPIRNPDAVADIKVTSTQAGMAKAYEQAQQEFPDWARASDFRAEFEPGLQEDPFTRFLSENYGLMIISELMLNPGFSDVILKMFWWIIDFSNTDISLLTCDRPYMVFRPLRNPHCLIYLPIGPSLGFFASPDPAKQGQLLRQKHRWIAKEMNRRQVSLAARFVYAADTQHTKLVAKHLRQI